MRENVRWHTVQTLLFPETGPCGKESVNIGLDPSITLLVFLSAGTSHC